MDGPRKCHPLYVAIYICLPVAIIDETLHMPNKISHCRCHLNFFFSMVQPTQMNGTYLHCAVSAQYGLGCGRELRFGATEIK